MRSRVAVPRSLCAHFKSLVITPSTRSQPSQILKAATAYTPPLQQCIILSSTTVPTPFRPQPSSTLFSPTFRSHTFAHRQAPSGLLTSTHRPTSSPLSLLQQVQHIQAPAHRSFSSSASLGAPRLTYNPSHRVRKRRHGFLSRINTRKGRMILKRRRQKGRVNMSH